jgi:hypothetical protein
MKLSDWWYNKTDTFRVCLLNILVIVGNILIRIPMGINEGSAWFILGSVLMTNIFWAIQHRESKF